jgi:hypothetical protein
MIYPVAMNEDALMACGLLLVVPAAAAGLLRGAGVRRAAIAGGVLAGVMLGPSVLGRVMPSFHERALLGGVEDRESLRAFERRRAADELAARWAELDGEARVDRIERFETERARLQTALERAAWRDQQAIRAIVVVLSALTLAGCCLGAGRAEGPRPHALAATNIGLWAAALPGGLAWLAATSWGYEPADAMMVAAAVSIGPAGLSADDALAAERAELGGARLITVAGRVASLAAIAVAAWSLHETRGWAGAAMALALGSSLPPAASSPAVRRHANRLVSGLLLPSLAASAMIRIDALSDWAIWPLIVLVLLSGDGRWLGAFIGAMLPGGRRSLRSLRLVMGAAGGSATQVAAIALALHAWSMPKAAASALMIGALLMDLTASARAFMVKRLEAAEEELGTTGSSSA